MEYPPLSIFTTVDIDGHLVVIAIPIDGSTADRYALVFRDEPYPVVVTGVPIPYMGDAHPRGEPFDSLREEYATDLRKGVGEDAAALRYAFSVGFHLNRAAQRERRANGEDVFVRAVPPFRVRDTSIKPGLYGHSSSIHTATLLFQKRNAVYTLNEMLAAAKDHAAAGDGAPGGKECTKLWGALAAYSECEKKYPREARWLERQGLTYGSKIVLARGAVMLDSRTDRLQRLTSGDRIELHMNGGCDKIFESDLCELKGPPVTPFLRTASFDIETVDPETAGTVPMWDNPHTYIYAIALCTDKSCTIFYARPPSAAPDPAILPRLQATVSDAEIVLVDSEKQLLTRFLSALRAYDPDVIITYNGDSYDWPFVLNRCVTHNIRAPVGPFENTSATARKKTFDTGAGQRDSFEVVTRLGGELRGGNERVTTMRGVPGVVLVDMYTVLLPLNLASHTLDAVSRHVLGDEVGKVDLSYAKQRALHLTEKQQDAAPPSAKRPRGGEAAAAISEILHYVAQDAHLPMKLMTTTITWPKTAALAAETFTPPQDILSRGQQIRVYTMLLRYAHEQGRVGNNPLDASEQLDKVPGATVLPPIVGFHAPAPAGALRELKELPPARLAELAALPTFSVVQVWDFMSLYPSIIITFLICYTNFRPRGDAYPLLRSMLQVDPEMREELGEDVLYTDYLDCFAKDPDCVLPTMLKRLFAQRKRYKRLMKEAFRAGDMAGYNAYNAGQLAVKVVMNSAYGFTGVLGGKGMYPEPALASTITACGRAIIDMTRDMACERHEFDVTYAHKLEDGSTVDVPMRVLVTPDAAEFAALGPLPADESGFEAVLLVNIVYGDTDSVMPKLTRFNEDLSDAAWEAVGSFCADRITAKFKEMFTGMGYPESWIILEYEKLYRGYMLDKKKRYAGFKIEPGKPGVLSTSGLLTARRDNPQMARRLYGELLECFIVKKDPAAAIQLLRAELAALVEGRAPLEDFVFTTQVRRAYANPEILGNQLKLRGEEQGTPVDAGRRVAYYYGHPRKPNGAAGRKAELYFENSPRAGQTGPCTFYLAKYLEKPIMGLLEHFSDHLATIGVDLSRDVRGLFTRTREQCKARGVGNRTLTAFFKSSKKS